MLKRAYSMIGFYPVISSGSICQIRIIQTDDQEAYYPTISPVIGGRAGRWIESGTPFVQSHINNDALI